MYSISQYDKTNILLINIEVAIYLYCNLTNDIVQPVFYAQLPL